MDPLRASSASPRASVRLGAFGKHPGWDDQIEDLGQLPPRLQWANRLLVDQSLAKLAEADAWGRLNAAERQPGFHHLVFWRTPDGLIVGRLWTSKDAKGRGDVPFALLALCEHVPVIWSLEHVLARLAGLEARLAPGTSQAVVRLALETAQGELDAQVRSMRPTMEVFPGSGSMLQRLAGHPDLAGEPKDPQGPMGGLVRVLFEFERHLGGFRPGKGSAGASTRHVRVPKCASRPGESARLWTALLDQEIDPSVPVLVIEPVEEGFTDLIVGEPDAAAMYCLRARERALPVVSEVPVDVPAGFVKQAGKRMEAWRRGATIPAGQGLQAPLVSRSAPAAPGGTVDSLEDLAAGLSGSGLNVGGQGELHDLTQGAGGKRGVWRAVAGVGAALAIAGGLLVVARSASLSPRGTIAARGGQPEEPAFARPAQAARPPTKVDPGASAGPGGSAEAGDRRVEGLDPRVAWSAGALLREAQESYRRVSAELRAEGAAGQVEGLGARLLGVEREIARIQGLAWTARTSEEISGSMAQVERELSAIRGETVGAVGALGERVAAHLQEMGARPPMPGVGDAWRGAMGKIDTARGWDWALSRADALDAAMRAADRRVEALEVAVPEGALQIEAGVVGKGVERERALVVAEVARELASMAPSSWDDPSAVEGATARALERSSRAREAWKSAAGLLLEDAAGIERGLAEGLGAGERDGQGLTVLERRARIEGSPAFASLDSAVGPILSRVAALERMGEERDAEMLVGQVGFAGERGGGLSEIVGGWERLGRLESAEDGAGLLQRAELYARVVRPAVEGAPVERREGLATRAREAARAMWTKFVDRHGGDEGAMSAAWRSRSDLECLEVEAPGWVKYNVARWQLASVLGGDADASRAAGAVDRFLEAVAGMPESVRGVAEVRGLEESLRALRDRGPGEALSRAGPGSVGWRVVSAAGDGSTVVYEWSGGEARLEGPEPMAVEFRRVEDGVRRAYVSTGEVSLGLFTRVVGGAGGSGEGLGRWEEMRGLLATFDPRTDDPRPGVRVWTWNPSAAWAWGGERTGPARGEPMVVSQGLPGDASGGWLRAMTRTNVAYYPDGMFDGAGGGSPSERMPMQYVSPRAAALMARLAGCRLPSSAEWKRAKEASAGSSANLRDARWARQHEHVRGLVSYAPDFPGAGAFWPLGKPRPGAEQDVEVATTADDGWLWFAPVGEASRGGVFEHVVGNVAEYVFEDPGAMERVEASATGVVKLLGRGERVRVIGGSAISSPSNGVDEALAVPFSQSLDGFSDVGFRLAFSAPEGMGEGAGGLSASGLARAREALGRSAVLAGP